MSDSADEKLPEPFRTAWLVSQKTAQMLDGKNSWTAEQRRIGRVWVANMKQLRRNYP